MRGLTQAQLKAEAERMIAAGEMPSLAQVLRAINETREEFHDKIVESRKKGTVQKQRTYRRSI